MSLADGVFSVPVVGIYHLEFSGLKDSSTAGIYVYLQVNGANVGISYTTWLSNFLALSGIISASLRLKFGDLVRLYKTSGALDDGAGGDQFIYFTGWLVEEDLLLGWNKHIAKNITTDII